MSFFEYLGGERPGYPPPDRVYAWVDAPSARRADGYSRLDCVDADWADEVSRQRSLSSPDMAPDAEPRVSMMLWRQTLGRRYEGRVLELRLEEARTTEEANVLHYMNLTGPPIPRMAVDASWPARGTATARRIARLTEIGGEDATEQQIRSALEAIPETIDAVGIYDVGQGSCSALVVNDIPQLYFDLGGGALADASTFPSNFSGICTTGSPTILLSHWHFDHWSLAKRFVRDSFGPDILSQLWIVPRQPRFGPSSATLLGLIRSYGTALVRAPGTGTTAVGALLLHGCAGRNLNDSGIGLSIGDGRGRTVLLPGDARYKYIAGLPRQVTSLVAAHHGGHTGAVPTEIPAPDSDPAGRLVYSCGYQNSYGHPLARSRQTHDVKWSVTPQFLTAERAAGQQPEHVHLYWDNASPDIRVKCAGQYCSLLPCRR